MKTDLLIPNAPRAIDPLETFRALVAWTEELIREKNAPGFIVGISGTDSILAFLICSAAFRNLGRPERVIGVHYGRPFPPADKTPEQIAHILKISPGFNWVSRVIVPWLKEQAPNALVTVDNSIDTSDDYQRWASLFKSSLAGADKTMPLPPGLNYWVVGTRNATEQMLGSYSNISGAASVQPIIQLWKSEILKICDALNVPKIAMENSRQVDCDCGRFDLAAHHIEEVDLILMTRAGVLSAEYLSKVMPADLQTKLEAFVDEQIRYADFKRQIPYKPNATRIVSAPQ